MVTHNKADQKDCKEQHTKDIKKSNNFFFEHVSVRCRNSAREFVGLIDGHGVIRLPMKDK